MTERECLAAVEAIKKFRCYLELQEFEIKTDHSSLLWLMRQPDLTGRLARWVFKLQGFKFTIRHRTGKEHVVPDALSRIPGGEIASIKITELEIDLSSPQFDSEEYKNLRAKIQKDMSKYPDVKIIDQYIYIRTDHYRGHEDQENECWKLWIPRELRDELLLELTIPLFPPNVEL